MQVENWKQKKFDPNIDLIQVSETELWIEICCIFSVVILFL